MALGKTKTSNLFGDRPIKNIDLRFKKLETWRSEDRALIDSLLDDTRTILGVRFSGGTSVTTGDRLLDNVGKTFELHTGSSDALDYPATDIRYMPPYSNIRTAKIDDDGKVVAWIYEATFSSAVGKIMTWIPKFYVKIVSSEEFYISDKRVDGDGFVVFPLFWDAENGAELDGYWISTMLASQDGLATTSATAAIPLVNQTRAQFREKAASIGAQWTQHSYIAYLALDILMRIATADKDSQAAIGKGISELRWSADDTVTVATLAANTVVVSNATAALYSVGQYIDVATSLGARNVAAARKITAISGADDPSVGNTTITIDGDVFDTSIGNVIHHIPQPVTESELLSVGNESGYVGTNGKSHCWFFGIADIWGNAWQFIDGVVQADGVLSYTFDPSLYADAPSDEWDTHPEVFPDSGWISTLSDELPFIPKEVGAGSSSGYADYFDIVKDGAFKVVRVGGYWNIGSYAGLFSWFADRLPSFSDITVASRLLCKPGT